MRERGLADAGHVLDEQMPAREQRHERQPDGLRLALDDAPDGPLQVADLLGRRRRARFALAVPRL